MCASYMIRQRAASDLRFVSDARVQVEEFFDQVILPYRPAPVIVDHKSTALLLPMKFSMVPSWSKEPKVKFATHNARFETIDTKPTWKWVFVQRHCLVPMSEFIEPIYEGEHAGHMVAFSVKSESLLLAAGVWDEWTNKETGEVVQSFAIITRDPPLFVAQIGHDRCPVFLDLENGEEWLQNVGTPAQDLKVFLQAQPSPQDFHVERHRAMRPGWEKRK